MARDPLDERRERREGEVDGDGGYHERRRFRARNNERGERKERECREGRDGEEGGGEEMETRIFWANAFKSNH